jgi:hypothetical protein
MVALVMVVFGRYGSFSVASPAHCWIFVGAVACAAGVMSVAAAKRLARRLLRTTTARRRTDCRKMVPIKWASSLRSVVGQRQSARNSLLGMAFVGIGEAVDIAADAGCTPGTTG